MDAKARILWVDDEIDLLRSHIILLEQRNYSVETATNGEDAVELFKNNIYDLVFLDESMVGISGLDTLPLLKDINPATPIVMVTKNEAETVMEDAIGKKIDDYLTKPVNPAQILLVCKKFLEVKELQKDRAIQSFMQDFALIQSKLTSGLLWEDWVEIYQKLVADSIELDNFPDSGLNQTLRDLWNESNEVFSKFVEENYVEWIHEKENEFKPLFSPEIVDKYLIPHLKSGQTVFFIVVDCMRYDQWLVFEELLQPYFTFKKEFYSAILPTATPYARNAIFAGLFPEDIQKYYPDMWVSELNSEEYKLNAYEKELLDEQLKRKRINLKTQLTYIKIHDTNFGKKIEHEASKFLNNHLTAIVFNAVDMIAHSRSDFAILKEIAPDESAYRSLTKTWFEHSSLFGILKIIAGKKNAKVILTTDHGSIRCMRGIKVLGDKDTSTNLRYKFGKNVKADPKYAMQISNPQDLRIPKFGLTINNIIAKEDYYFVYPTDFHHYLQKYKDSFQHGGISMEEMIVPVIEMEPR